MREYKNLGPLYEWSEDKAYLIIDQVRFRDKLGAILCYCNPPVHQVGNPELDAYLEGLGYIKKEKENIDYLILYGANDPVHAGGDIKESLKKLDETLATKKEREAAGASPEEVDRLFAWAEKRLEKGRILHGTIRELAMHLRIVAVCGGGTRYGGSAEIPLMADYLVGDSRSAMCFSEAMIGIIPGWAGIVRSFIKAGLINAQYMGKTAREITADQLKMIGIYNLIVHVPFPFPKKRKTDDPEADKAAYMKALDKHNDETGLLLLPKGLELATCPALEIPVVSENERPLLAAQEEISQEVCKRMNPQTYIHLWGKPLKEVKEEIALLGRPLASQSIEALNSLFEYFDSSRFDENRFVEREVKVDAGLYRDKRLRSGLIAVFEQTVANFSS